MTSYFVDSAGGNNASAGDVGDPWETIDYGAANITDGDKLNLRGNAAHTLGGALSWPTTGGIDSPTHVRGYTTAEGDGGRASVLPNGYNFTTPTQKSLKFVDLSFSGSFSGAWFNGGQDSIALRCVLDMTGSSYGFRVSSYGSVMDCVITGGVGPQEALSVGAYGSAIGNYLEVDGGVSSNGIINLSSGGALIRNVIVLTGDTGSATFIVEADGSINNFYGNTIYAPNGSALTAIHADSTTRNSSVMGNIIAGFSGAGGKAIEVNDGCYDLAVTRNAFYDNETNIDYGTGATVGEHENETLGSNPFAAVGSATDPDDVLAYYAPQDTGNLLTGGTFGQHKGAICPASGGGSSPVGLPVGRLISGGV